MSRINLESEHKHGKHNTQNMSEVDKMNENSAEPETKETVPIKSETEKTEASSPNESFSAVLNEDCNDLNTENHNEGNSSCKIY